VSPGDFHGATVVSKQSIRTRRVNIQAIVTDHEKRVTVPDQQIARLEAAALRMY
jgi:hypothetical protein